MPNVNSKILSKVIEYCSFHVAAEKQDEHGKPAKSEDEVKVGAAARPPLRLAPRLLPPPDHETRVGMSATKHKGGWGWAAA